MNRIDLEGRHAVITGGGQGLGYAMAKRMIESGARVTLWDMDGEVLATACAALGPETAGEVVDVSDWDQVERARAATLARGPVDIIVNSAGIAGPVSSWMNSPKLVSSCGGRPTTVKGQIAPGRWYTFSTVITGNSCFRL